MKAYTPLFLLWLAITIPVVGVGGYLYKNLHTVTTHTVTNTKLVVVTPTTEPTATPSAVKTFYKAVTPTVKGGVK